MFKVGDPFLSIDNDLSHRTFGKVYQVTEIVGNRVYYICDYGKRRSFSKRHPEGVGVEKLPLNNPLNRKLYPDRVEYNGYLVPRKAAAKLKEQE